jgi:outer membrane biosynthesis protein TonB
MGYVDVDIKDKRETIFISKTAKGTVMTMPAEQEGPLPVKTEGLLVVYGTPQDVPVEGMYAMHRKALGTEAPLMEEAWLKENVPKLPQRTIDVAMMVMNEMLAALGGADGLMEAMGNAMAGAMEGIGKGMAEAMSGIGDAMSQPEIKTEPEVKPEPKVVRKPPTKKVPPKKAAPKKAAKPAKKKAPSKAEAKPKAKSGKKKR